MSEAQRLRGRDDVLMHVERSFIQRAEDRLREGPPEDLGSFTPRARDAGWEWLQALSASGEFDEVNFLDTPTRERMVDWLDEHGELDRVITNEEPHPGAKREAASVVLAWYAAMLQVQWDDEALRCFDAAEAGVPTYHRRMVIE